MSYDVRLVVSLGDDDIEVTPTRNYTFNIWKMLKTSLCGTDIARLDGHLALEVVGQLESAIELLTTKVDLYDGMNPENGWGSRAGCVEWLRKIVEDCERYPLATLRVT